MNTLFTDDLLEVFHALPRSALRLLLDRLEVLFGEADCHKLISAALRSPSTIVPDEVVDLFSPVLSDGPPGQPLAYYLHRALHRMDFDVAAPDNVWPYPRSEQLRPLLCRVLDDAPAPSFLYEGLFLASPDSRVLRHVSAFLDVHAVGFLGRSVSAKPAILDPALVAAATSVALKYALKHATVASDSATVEGVEHEDVLHWLESVGSGNVDILPILAELDALPPARMVWRKPKRLVEVKSDDDEPRFHDRDPDVAYVRAGDTRPQYAQRVLYDIARTWNGANERAFDAVAKLATRHPQLASHLVPQLSRMAACSNELHRSIAAASPVLLSEAVRLNWDGLSEHAVLVNVALQVQDASERIRILVALGKVAQSHVQRQVQEDINLVCGCPDGADEPTDALRRLGHALDNYPHLGLAFWISRMSRNVQICRLAKDSARMRAAFRLDPSPLLRLIRRHAKDPRLAASALYLVLMNCPERIVDVADEAVSLALSGGFRRWERIAILGSVPSRSPDATAALLVAVGEVASDQIDPLDIGRSDALWRAFTESGRVSGDDLLRCLGEGSALETMYPRLVRAPLLALVAATAAAISDPERRGSSAVQRAIRILTDSRDAEVVRSVGPLLVALGSTDQSDYRAPRRAREGVASSSEELLGSLLEPDLGELHVALGEWFGARVTEGELWFSPKATLRRSILARLSSSEKCDPSIAAPIALALGDEWPTRTNLELAAAKAGLTLDAEVFDKVADEAIPEVFRRALGRVIATGELPVEGYEFPVDAWQVLDWILGWVWRDSPELVAKQVARLLDGDVPRHWQRALVLVLVALRESCGTTVPDAITRLAHSTEDADWKHFLITQRNTFARAHSAQEAKVAARTRAATAFSRLLRAARSR